MNNGKIRVKGKHKKKTINQPQIKILKIAKKKRGGSED